MFESWHFLSARRLWLGLWMAALTAFQASAEVPEFVWVAHAGGTNGHAKTRGIVVDAAGNTHVTGEFSGTAIFGNTTLKCNGPLDCYVAKFGPDGKVLWANQAGGAAIDRGYGIALDASGNSYVTGHFQQTNGVSDAASAALSKLYDIFVAKYDGSGKLLWMKQFPGNGYNYGHGVALDAVGNLYISGGFSRRTEFDAQILTNKGVSEIFLAKFDPSGKVLLAQKTDAGPGNAANSIAHDQNGHCFIAGSFATRGNFGRDVLTSRGANDALVLKVDATGKALWARQAGAVTNDFAHCVAADSAGNCYVSGAVQGTAIFNDKTKFTAVGKHDAFVAKYDANGNLVWMHHGGAEGTDYALGVAVDKAQNCFVTGEYTGGAMFGDTRITSLGGTDIFLAKINAAGRQEWVLTAGGTKTDYSYCIAVDNAGYAFISGGFGGTATFGNKDVKAQGLSDMFIAKVRVTP